MNLGLDGKVALVTGGSRGTGDAAVTLDVLTPDEIGMTKISVPNVFEYAGVKPEDWGVSGFVLIAESHIAVHTFPEHGQVWVDIFSCKGFDEIPAIDKIVDAFSLRSTRIHKLERGLEYPHDVNASIPLNRTERREVTPVG